MGRLAGILAPVLILASLRTACACNIPVFRYALERWPAEPYEAIIFSRGKLQPDASAALEKLKGAANVRPAPNLECREVDVAQPLPADMAELWKSLDDPVLPFLVVRYPLGPRAPTNAFSGPLSAELVPGLLDSPARRELAKRLLAGESAVWLLLKSGSAAQDAAAHKMLEGELKGLEKELKLPDQNPDGDQMARPVADLPLRLSFSIISLSREDAAERVFVRMLLSLDKELAAERGVIAFPVFGRARLLCAIRQKDLTHDAIAEVAEFVTGACSCQVKELNPGTDLLVAADWDALMEGRAVQDPAPPALTGITSSIAGNADGKDALLAGPAQREPALAESALRRNVFVAAAVLLFAVAAASVLLKLKAGRKRN